MTQRTVLKAGVSFEVVQGADPGHDAFWTWFEAESWEPDTIAAFAAVLSPGLRMLDVGAWIGPTALLAAAMGAEVVALEPDPLAAEMLERNVALNPELGERIRIVRAAIAAEDGQATLVADNGGGDSLSHLRFHDGLPATSWRVRTLSAASLLERERPAFVKIDSEGAEYAAIPAMRGQLEKQRPSLYLSTHPNLLYDKRTVASRILTGRAALRGNRDMLRALMTYRHHYVHTGAGFEDVRLRNRLRATVALPLRSSLLIGSALFTDRSL